MCGLKWGVPKWGEIKIKIHSTFYEIDLYYECFRYFKYDDERKSSSKDMEPRFINLKFKFLINRISLCDQFVCEQ